MRYLRIGEVKEGMVLGRTVYDATGTILLQEGIILTERYLERLKELGYPALYVRSSLDDRTATIIEPVRQETVLKAKTVLGELAAEQVSGQAAPAVIQRVTGAVDDLIDELLANKELVLNMVEIRSYDSYTFSHSVSTAILSLMAGISLGLDRSQLADLGVGAILHDLGKIFVSAGILNKPERLTPEEFEQVKNHTTRGYHLLRDRVNLLAAHIAYQHHERCNGSGYPRHLKRDNIIPYARIVAVADSYDAMTSDRVYSPAKFPHKAATTLLDESADRYDPDAVKAVLRNVAPYPIGSVILLAGGELGEVLDTTRSETTILIVRGPRRGATVKSPGEATIMRRVSWGKWS